MAAVASMVLSVNAYGATYQEFLDAIKSAEFEYSESSPNGVFYYLQMKDGYTLTFDGYYIADENYYYVNDESDITYDATTNTTTIFISMADDPVEDKAGLDLSVVTVFLNNEEVEWDYNAYLMFTRKGTTQEEEGDIQTALDNTAAEAKAVKSFRNGQLVIKKGDKTYNILGAELK